MDGAASPLDRASLVPYTCLTWPASQRNPLSPMATKKRNAESPMPLQILPLPLLKTMLASFAVLLALEQAWTMAEVRGYTKFLPRRPRVLVRIHR